MKQSQIFVVFCLLTCLATACGGSASIYDESESENVGTVSVYDDAEDEASEPEPETTTETGVGGSGGGEEESGDAGGVDEPAPDPDAIVWLTEDSSDPPWVRSPTNEDGSYNTELMGLTQFRFKGQIDQTTLKTLKVKYLGDNISEVKVLLYDGTIGEGYNSPTLVDEQAGVFLYENLDLAITKDGVSSNYDAYYTVYVSVTAPPSSLGNQHGFEITSPSDAELVSGGVLGGDFPLQTPVIVLGK